MSKETDHLTPPQHVNPDLGLGDVWKYSGLIAQLVAVIEGARAIPVGGETDFPMVTSWLPDGHEWELTLHGKKKK